MELSEIEKTCPLCGKPNNCKMGSGNCWCNHVIIPKELIDTIPEDEKDKACICLECVEGYERKMNVDIKL